MTQENIPNERKKPGHVNIRQAAVHSSNFGSFSASPLNDHDDNSGSPWAAQYDRRQPSISFTDEQQFGGHHREFSYDRGSFDPHRHRGISIASSHASFMAERFDNGRARNYSMAGSEMFDDSLERSMPNVHFAGSNQIGSPQSFGLATDAFGRFSDEMKVTSFETTNHDRQLWTGLEQRLKIVNEKALDLMTFKSEIEMILDGSDPGHESRFANLAHVLKRVTPSRYDDSKPLVEQTMNLDVPEDLMYVLECLDRDPKSISKHELITIRRRLYDHAANNHNNKTNLRTQEAMLEKMNELAKDIEQELKEFGNASAMLVNRLLSDLEREEVTHQEFEKNAEAVKHFQRRTLFLEHQVSSLEDKLEHAVHTAEADYLISDSEETPSADLLPTIPHSSARENNLGAPRPKHGRYATQDLEHLKDELQKEHHKDNLVLEDKISELLNMNEEKHSEQSMLKAKLQKKEQAVVELRRVCEELTMNLDSYKTREMEHLQELNDQKEQLEMARSQFQRLETQLASRVLPREFKPISLESELDMMKYVDTSESALKSPVGSGPGSLRNHFSDQSVTSNTTATEHLPEVAFFTMRDSRSVSILTDCSRPDDSLAYMNFENHSRAPPPSETHVIPPQSQPPHSISPQPAKAASLEQEIPGMAKQDSHMSSGSSPLPVVVLPAAASSSDPPSANPPDSDPSRNVSSPAEHNEEQQQESGEGGDTAGAMGINVGDTDKGVIVASNNSFVSNPGANPSPQKPFKLSALGMNSFRSEEIMAGWDGGSTYEERRRTDRSRVPLDRMESDDANERMMAYRSTNSMRHRMTRDSNISVTAPPQEHQVFELRNRVQELERDLKDTKHYLSFAYETIRILETEKRRRNMAPQQLSNSVWEEEKKEYLNVISRIEADNDNLKYQLDKTKKQYRKLLKRVPHSVAFSNEVSVVLSLLALAFPAANRGEPSVLPQLPESISRTAERAEIFLGIQQSGSVES